MRRPTSSSCIITAVEPEPVPYPEALVIGRNSKQGKALHTVVCALKWTPGGQNHFHYTALPRSEPQILNSHSRVRAIFKLARESRGSSVEKYVQTYRNTTSPVGPQQLRFPQGRSAAQRAGLSPLYFFFLHRHLGRAGRLSSIMLL